MLEVKMDYVDKTKSLTMNKHKYEIWAIEQELKEFRESKEYYKGMESELASYQKAKIQEVMREREKANTQFRLDITGMGISSDSTSLGMLQNEISAKQELYEQDKSNRKNILADIQVATKEAYNTEMELLKRNMQLKRQELDMKLTEMEHSREYTSEQLKQFEIASMQQIRQQESISMQELMIEKAKKQEELQRKQIMTTGTWQEVTKLAFQDAAKEAKTFNETLYEASQMTINSMSDGLVGAIEEAIKGTKTFGEAFTEMSRQIVVDLGKMILKQAIFNSLSSAFGSGSGSGSSTGGFLSSLFGFASGGIINEPVMGVGRSGKGYMIGEKGPEKITPLGQTIEENKSDKPVNVNIIPDESYIDSYLRGKGGETIWAHISSNPKRLKNIASS
ncbi:MAG: hypothetical protein GF411_19905 [Candidatus Lokiarchaeota archaeon]|nr:hypothetical protein [Candidatus Lokiarchaeota archaeon]